VLRTLAALGLTLTVDGDEHARTARGHDAIPSVDIDAIISAHKGKAR
jgi:hypothetical protein